MAWENENLDQDILQCRQDIEKARRKFARSDETASEKQPDVNIPIREVPNPQDAPPTSNEAQSRTEPLRPADNPDQTIEHEDAPSRQSEYREDENAQELPSFEQVIERHARIHDQQTGGPQPGQEDTEKTLPRDSEQIQPPHQDETINLNLQTDRKIEQVTVNDLSDTSVPETTESASNAKQTPNAYDVTEHELDELERQWRPLSGGEHPPRDNTQQQIESEDKTAKQHQVPDHPEPVQNQPENGSLLPEDEEDKILEELINQSSLYQDQQPQPRDHYVEQDQPRERNRDTEQHKTDPDNQEQQIPEFDLAKQILAEKRRDIARRRQGPGATAKTKKAYPAQGTVAEVINYSKQNRPAEEKTEPNAPERKAKTHILTRDNLLDIEKRNIISQIVRKDIDKLFNKQKHTQINETVPNI